LQYYGVIISIYTTKYEFLVSQSIDQSKHILCNATSRK